jgi:hypothetical protein
MNPPLDPQKRYAGKPLVRLLDAYVLWAIGALPPAQEASLQQMTPKLRQTWNRTEEHWQDVLASEMHFPATMPATIREMWEKNQTIAVTSRVTLTPLDFAHMFVDQNFNR